MTVPPPLGADEPTPTSPGRALVPEPPDVIASLLVRVDKLEVAHANLNADTRRRLLVLESRAPIVEEHESRIDDHDARINDMKRELHEVLQEQRRVTTTLGRLADKMTAESLLAEARSELLLGQLNRILVALELEEVAGG